MSMERSWLIQRMQKPTGRVNPFSFGGGGSGFHPEVAKQLAEVCDWDYMGAAEYEFGAPAKALNRMILAKKKLTAGAMKVPYRYDSPQWGDRIAKQFVGTGKVFYLCPKKDAEEVIARIAKWATNYKHGDTRDNVKLDASLAGEEANPNGIYGWFDLDNDFMFFTDEKMWRAMCDGLDVKVPSKKNLSKQMSEV